MNVKEWLITIILLILAAITIPVVRDFLERSGNTPATVTAPPITITTTRPPRETITVTPTITVYKDDK